MSKVDEIRKLLDTDVPMDIKSMVFKALELVRQAKQAGEEVPIDIETDVILKANYAYGFGNEQEDAQQILNLLVRSKSVTTRGRNFYQLAAIASSAVITAMSVDEQSNLRSVNAITRDLGIEHTSTRFEILRKMTSLLIDYLINSRPESYVLEVLSFLLVFVSMLKEYEKWDDDLEQHFLQLGSIFQHELDERENDNIETWKHEFVEKNDFYRFSFLLIFNRASSETIWIENAESLLAI